MPRRRKKELWEKHAEELVRLLSALLLDHGDAIEKALKKSIGRERAEARIRQLEYLTRALDDELFRKGQQPDRTIVGTIGKAAAVVLLGFGTQLGTVVATDIHDTIHRTQKRADDVAYCAAVVVLDDEEASNRSRDREFEETVRRTSPPNPRALDAEPRQPRESADESFDPRDAGNDFVAEARDADTPARRRLRRPRMPGRQTG